MSESLDIGGMVEDALKGDMTIWVEFIDGFEVEIRFVGREKFQKLYEKCVKFDWNPKTHKREDIPDREKFLKLWAEKAVKNWKGLTLGKLANLIPINLDEGVDTKLEVPATVENRVTLLKHNAEFDDFVISIANNYQTFKESLNEIKEDVANLKQ